MNRNNIELDWLAKAYFTAKKYVINCGFSAEIDWQDSSCFNSITSKSFLREYTWVVLSSGLSDKAVIKVFPKILSIFKDWDNLTYIQKNINSIKLNALEVFNNPLKINAIISTTIYVKNHGIESIKRKIQIIGIEYIKSFPFIGSTTCYHLAKNIGLSYAKPDRHLMRISNRIGFKSPNDLCRIISEFTDEKIQVVDIVLWRYATLDKNYEKKLIRLGFN